MEKILWIYSGGILYGSSAMVTLAIFCAICGFLFLYLRKNENTTAAFITPTIALALSLALARLLHWYAHPESYSNLLSAFSDFSNSGFVLAGAFIGCWAAAVLTEKVGLHNTPPEMLDCMSLAGGAAISIGRLSALFNTSARGQIIHSTYNLPWINPIINSVSGVTEIRFSTFLIQAIITAIITASLMVFYRRRDNHYKDGDTALLFLLCYCAAQIVLDSTRYDAIYFRNNGFISIVQISCALTVIFVILVFSIRMVKKHGLVLWNLLLWGGMLPLLGTAGYMEYYVQRHSNKALFAYSMMSLCLTIVVYLTICLYRHSKRPNSKN